MTDQSNTKPANFTETFNHLTQNLDRLETALEQSLQALRKRGIQLSVDLTGMVRTVRQDLESVSSGVSQNAGRLHQLQELVRVSALLNSSLELDRVLEEVMDTVIQLTGAERGYLMLQDKNTGELEIRTARNWDRESLLEGEAIFSRGIINTAIEQRQPILTTNAQDDARFQGMQSVMSHALRSIICVPLQVRGQIVGVLYADNHIGQGVFNPDSLSILSAFANQASIAIQNARLFSQVKADLVVAQKEVQELRIMIDEGKKDKQVKEITNSEYFRELEAMARTLRRRKDEGNEEGK
ncbi:MAG TPA: GAF domain-containing protein [Aggregatilineales bacterium]|nr:GAF domain-containing protein [Anaerolineales bacterium]HRE48929.1 GAF domain-containing protein [Aggregatilineales bacterium]